MGAHSRREDTESSDVDLADFVEVNITADSLDLHSIKSRQCTPEFANIDQSYSTARLYRETEEIHVQRFSGVGGDRMEVHQIAQLEAELAAAKLEIAYLRTQIASDSSSHHLEDMNIIRQDLTFLRKNYEEDQARLAVTISRGRNLCALLLDVILAFKGLDYPAPKDRKSDTTDRQSSSLNLS